MCIYTCSLYIYTYIYVYYIYIPWKSLPAILKMVLPFGWWYSLNGVQAKGKLKKWCQALRSQAVLEFSNYLSTKQIWKHQIEPSIYKWMMFQVDGQGNGCLVPFMEFLMGFWKEFIGLVSLLCCWHRYFSKWQFVDLPLEIWLIDVPKIYCHIWSRWYIFQTTFQFSIRESFRGHVELYRFTIHTLPETNSQRTWK